MASRNKGRKMSSPRKKLLLHPCRDVIKVKETGGNKSSELWYSFLYSWWKGSMKGQTILILLSEVSHSSCCQCYSAAYPAKSRLHHFMAIARKNALKGRMDAFVYFHFPFPWNADSLKAKLHAQVRLEQDKCYGMWENVQVWWFLHPKLPWVVGECSWLFILLAEQLHTVLTQLLSHLSFLHLFLSTPFPFCPHGSYNILDLGKGTVHRTKREIVE